MTNSIRNSLAFLGTGLTLATAPVLAAEPTDVMRMMARLTVIVEAHDLKGYCAEMNATSFTVGLTKACQKDVQKNLKQPEDCTPERIAQFIEDDHQKCLAMPAAEFDKVILNGRKVKAELVKQMQDEGVDGEKLFQEERAKQH